MRKTQNISKTLARRINARMQLRSLLGWLLLDLLAAAGAVAAWCGATELAATGELIPDISRAFYWTESTGFAFLEYRFGDTVTYTAAAGRLFLVLAAVLALAAALEFFVWLLRWMSSARKIRKILRPIDDLTAAAGAISSAAPDESKFRDLAEAIDHLNAASPSAKLAVGDADIAGLESAVNGLIARMHEAYRQQTRFVDDASHELRTPIAVIQGYVNMLDRWGKNDETVLNESIEAIKTESEHMKTLVEQLLFLARGDMGRQKFKPEPLELRDMLTEVLEESRMLDAAHPYALSAPQSLSVQADPAMLKQAVRILVDNAAKYTPAGGGVALRLRAAQNRACIDVQDEGVGISAPDAAHVFERFYRGDKARSSTAGGSGLGLSIARWIVEQHGGSLELLSYEGVGSRFTISLPLPPPVPAAPKLPGV